MKLLSAQQNKHASGNNACEWKKANTETRDATLKWQTSATSDNCQETYISQALVCKLNDAFCIDDNVAVLFLIDHAEHLHCL